MNWRKVSSVVAQSDKDYELRVSYLRSGSNRRAFYNAWAPTGKHVSAGLDRSQVLAECEAHYERDRTVA